MAMKGILPSQIQAASEAEQAFLFSAFVWEMEQQEKEMDDLKKQQRGAEKPKA